MNKQNRNRPVDTENKPMVVEEEGIGSWELKKRKFLFKFGQKWDGVNRSSTEE